jgi:hypothetical protein
MDFTKVKSSTITEVAYDPAEQRLHVRFKSGGEYCYHDVPPGLHADMMAADSVGKFFHSSVKGQFRHGIVDDEP